jgi:Leucine rich repeat
MPMLKSIKLNNNLLQHIGEAVFTELKLQHLDLSGNNLSSDNFLWPESIEIRYLNLTFNAYTSINSSLLTNIETDLYGELIH